MLRQTLRRLGARGPELARARGVTLRLQLLQVGARVRITTRRVGLSFSQAYPYAALCAQVLAHLRREPLGVSSG